MLPIVSPLALHQALLLTYTVATTLPIEILPAILMRKSLFFTLITLHKAHNGCARLSNLILSMLSEGFFSHRKTQLTTINLR